jgi:hypothetical protein
MVEHEKLPAGVYGPKPISLELVKELFNIGVQELCQTTIDCQAIIDRDDPIL